MKNLYFALISLFFLPLSGVSQGENDKWYFGRNAAVDFSSTPPEGLIDSAMDTSEGVATVSDSAGNLLFYTNGSKIWNKNHQVMATSSNWYLNGSWTAIQGVAIVPYPNHPNEYFVFTSNAGDYNFGAVVKVDMTANGGLGSVVSNQILLDHLGNSTWSYKTESITVTKHANNYWVLIAYNTYVLAYKVDQYGVHTTPTVSQLNTNYIIDNFECHIKVSPNQNYLTISDYKGDDFTVYNFNSSTGTIQGTPIVAFNNFMYSSAFSSSGNILWVSDFWNYKIYGYDLTNLNAPPAEFPAGDPPDKYPTSLQRGPDDEIYVSILDSYFVGKISNSNNLSTATYNPNAIYLKGKKCSYGLPQIVPSGICISDLVLTIPEVSGVIHKASNSITLKTNFEVYVDPGYNTILSAGNYVEMLPNTFLIADWNFVLAEIEGCTPTVSRPVPPTNMDYQTKIINLPENGTQVSDMELYPNPVVDVVNITLPSSVELESATLHNLLGKQTQVSLGENNSIDMSQMAAGVYILKLETNQGSLTKKIIKQ